MQRILLAPLCLGILSTSGCYVDPAGVSTSVGVGVGASPVKVANILIYKHM